MATGICSPIANRVQQLASSIGLGDVSFSGTLQCSQSFASAFTAGDEVMYTITDCLDCDPTSASLSGGSWEIGCAVWDGTKLLRSSGNVEASSNGGALVNFTSQDLAVFHSVNGSWYQSTCDAFTQLQIEIEKLKRNQERIGTVTMWPTDVSPDTHLFCHGQTISQTDYPELVDALQTNVLPNYGGRFPLGAAGNIWPLNTTGGEIEVILTEPQMPVHTHANGIYNKLGRNDGNHTTIQTDFNVGQLNTREVAEMLPAGGGQPHNNMPPYYTTNFIIRAKHC